MKRIFSLPVILSIIIVILAVGLVGVLLFLNNQKPPIRGVAPVVAITAQEPDSSKWGLNFPNEYSSLLMTKTNNKPTTYGGSEPFDKLAKDVRLVDLFAGNAFSIGYNEDRGHLNSLEDVRTSKRISDKTPGTCYSCKSSQNPKMWAEMGMEKYDATSFAELGKQITESIGCANCHEANTMRLIVTNPALDAALKKQGKDWHTFTRQEMRSVVCANCHVEYYFTGVNKELTLPWDNGTNIDNIAATYEQNQFVDWTHKESGAKMIKIQHPDFELYTSGSTHFVAGVSCADCHMPYMRDGSAKYSSHDVQSPYENPAQSCGSCHTDVNRVVERAKAIQKQVADTMSSTEDALVQAIQAISTAAASANVDSTKLEEARNLHRQAQLRWDFIAAENSMGFHNPTESLRVLAESTDLARQAQIKAILAVSANH